MLDHFDPTPRSHRNRHIPGVTLPQAPFTVPPATTDASAPYDRKTALGYTFVSSKDDPDTDTEETLIDVMARFGPLELSEDPGS